MSEYLTESDKPLDEVLAIISRDGLRGGASIVKITCSPPISYAQAIVLIMRESGTNFHFQTPDSGLKITSEFKSGGRGYGGFRLGCEVTLDQYLPAILEIVHAVKGMGPVVELDTIRVNTPTVEMEVGRMVEITLSDGYPVDVVRQMIRAINKGQEFRIQADRPLEVDGILAVYGIGNSTVYVYPTYISLVVSRNANPTVFDVPADRVTKIYLTGILIDDVWNDVKRFTRAHLTWSVQPVAVLRLVSDPRLTGYKWTVDSGEVSVESGHPLTIVLRQLSLTNITLIRMIEGSKHVRVVCSIPDAGPSIRTLLTIPNTTYSGFDIAESVYSIGTPISLEISLVNGVTSYPKYHGMMDSSGRLLEGTTLHVSWMKATASILDALSRVSPQTYNGLPYTKVLVDMEDSYPNLISSGPKFTYCIDGVEYSAAKPGKYTRYFGKEVDPYRMLAFASGNQLHKEIDQNIAEMLGVRKPLVRRPDV